MAVEILPWPAPIQHSVTETMDYVGSVLWDMVEKSKASLVPKPTRVIHVNPGRQVPWDECCVGQLAGRVLTITPFTGPRGSTSLGCGVVEYVVTLGISIIRCVATVDDSGQAPTPAEMDADGLQMTRDLANIMRVIQCHPATRTMGAWNPLGNQGGCGGGEWTFQVRIPVCPCKD